jgi:hypothetical protein
MVMLNFTTFSMNFKITFFFFQLSVHFSGQVENGPSLESSYDKGSSFHFKLGQGKRLVYFILLEKVEL